MLEVEVKRDKNSDNSITTKLAYNTLLPDRKNKKYDLVDDFIKEKYFEVIPELGKNNESFYIKDFIGECGPIHYPTDEIIKKYEDLIEKVKDMSQVKKYVAEEFDFLKKIKKAHELCEEYMKSIEKK